MMINNIDPSSGIVIDTRIPFFPHQYKNTEVYLSIWQAFELHPKPKRLVLIDVDDKPLIMHATEMLKF